MRRFLFGAVCAVVGLALAIAIEASVLGLVGWASGSTFAPRGLGWFAIPVAATVGGWGFGIRAADKNVPPHIERVIKIAGGALASWWLLIFGYLWLVQPYGYWISPLRAIDLYPNDIARWALGAPVLVCIMAVIMALALRSHRSAS